jgi:hypothetical protein
MFHSRILIWFECFAYFKSLCHLSQAAVSAGIFARYVPKIASRVCSMEGIVFVEAKISLSLSYDSTACIVDCFRSFGA